MKVSKLLTVFMSDQVELCFREYILVLLHPNMFTVKLKDRQVMIGNFIFLQKVHFGELFVS